MNTEKNTTSRIVMRDPALQGLNGYFTDRNLCPNLLHYVRHTVAGYNSGTRRINIPSAQDDVGVILLGNSELHVFFRGKTVVFKWEAKEKKGLLVPKKEYGELEITNVQVVDEQVTVNLVSSNKEFSIVVNFAQYAEQTTLLSAPHPLD